MAWTVDSSGTETPTLPVTCTFTNASQTCTVTQNAAVNDMVVFTTTGVLPTPLTAGTTYYILSRTATTLTGISLTRGGSAIANYNTAGQSGTHTATFEQVFAEPTTVATYEFSCDLSLMAVGDLVELRCYDMVDATNYRQVWKGAYQHVQFNAGKVSPAKAVTTQAKFTIKQLAGTVHAYPWSLRRI